MHLCDPRRDLRIEQDLAQALAHHSRVIVSEDGATYTYQSAIPVGAAGAALVCRESSRVAGQSAARRDDMALGRALRWRNARHQSEVYKEAGCLGRPAALSVL
jgi:hypothetical protein